MTSSANEMKATLEALAAEYEAEGNAPVARTLDEMAELPEASLLTLHSILSNLTEKYGAR